MTVILEFLTELFQSGLGYSAVNTARSALSAVVKTDSGIPIGTHSAVSRFLKGVYELRTPTPRYHSTWDVSVLLAYLKEKGTNSSLSLKDLTIKVCAMLLLASAQRLQTIHSLRLSCIDMQEGCCVIKVVDKLKTSRPGFHQLPLKFFEYEDECLCVMHCLKEYISRTAPVRGSDKLILCFQKPHKPASKDSISRWMKMLLANAGIQNFGAHSFRGAASSAMLRGGVSIEEIMKTAGWTKATTFQRFYNKPLEKSRKLMKKNSILNYYVQEGGMKPKKE